MIRVGLLSALALLGLWPGSAVARDDASYVNPFQGSASALPDLGTGGSAGNTFPGAVAPHGMVQWSPDTIPSTQNFAGGYSFGDQRLRGFSLTHMSGAGCASLQDVSFLPTTAPVTTSPAVPASSDIAPQYVPSFDHADERAHPGSYQVMLNPRSSAPIDSQLTALGTRTSLGRFTYPPTHAASMLVNAGGSAMADYEASVKIDPAHNVVTGSAQSGEFCFQTFKYRLYFAAKFSRPFKAFGTWDRQKVVPGSTSSADVGSHPSGILNYKPIPGGPLTVAGDPSGTAQAGAYLTFDTTANRAVEVRVAVSSVSTANAVANLSSTGASWNFARAATRINKLWDAKLGAIGVRGGSARDRATFYTALYHTMIDPQTYSDANGEYLGMDGRVHTASGYTQYADFSGWDIYRTMVPLTAMIDPVTASGMVSSLLADQRQSGWLPKWPLQNQQTEIQVGDPADPIIAGAFAFGARGFDTKRALGAMIKGATRTGASPDNGYIERQALARYETLHYVPEEINNGSGSSTTPYTTGGGATIANPSAVWGSAATTLEDTTADFAIARFAGATGNQQACHAFLARSAYWKSLFNPTTGYLQPRYATGAFDPVFDPTQATGWVEGSTAQYTWMVPYDVGGLFARMGGKGPADARLRHFFAKLNDGPVSQYAFLGNEPTLQTPWLYDWAGAPARTQATVRRALRALYGPGVTDYPGNDDLGTLAAWSVFAALGMYPEIPGSDELTLASPLFPHVVIHLRDGDLVIDAASAGPTTPYVRSMSVNGAASRHPWLHFAALASGAHVRFALGGSPTAWGAASSPPSYPAGSSAACRPFRTTSAQ